MKTKALQFRHQCAKGYFVAWCTLLLATTSILLLTESRRRQNLSEHNLSAQYRSALDIQIPLIVSTLRQCASDTLARRRELWQQQSGLASLSLRGGGARSGTANPVSSTTSSQTSNPGISAERFDNYPSHAPELLHVPLDQVVCPSMQEISPQPTLFSDRQWLLPDRQFSGVFLPAVYSKGQIPDASYVRITFKTLDSHEGAANALRSYARKQNIRNSDGTYAPNPDVVIEADEKHVLMHVYLEKTP